ncbi:MAG: hypothetical protein KDH20_00275 [Rhodocyclaceae bacterium]|nr:hypothetical protein [Rhodocyclaceae bacterium]
MDRAFLPFTPASPADLHAQAAGVANPPLTQAQAIACLRQQHDELGTVFCTASAELTALWQAECERVSDSHAHLHETAFRARLDAIASGLFDTFRRLKLREEDTLRMAGMRRFDTTWREHKQSHARFLRQLAASLTDLERDSPGCIARELAILIDEYWAVHALDHDHLAFSLLDLLGSRLPQSATDGELPEPGNAGRN